jgi:hypothetical protein
LVIARACNRALRAAGIIVLIYPDFQAKLGKFISTKHRAGLVGGPGGFCQIGSEMKKRSKKTPGKRTPTRKALKRKGETRC